MARQLKKILAIRNDRFGEFLLNIPALKALRLAYPGASLSLIVNPYVAELCGCIDFIDEVIPWENRKRSFFEVLKFSRLLKRKGFDLCLILNPAKASHLASFLAGIPERVGYGRKWGFLLTRKIRDEKCLAKKHEVEYNLELAELAGEAVRQLSLRGTPSAAMGTEAISKKGLLRLFGARNDSYWTTSGAKPIDLELNLALDGDIINNSAKKFGLAADKKYLAIHPFTSDPLKQWPEENFLALATRLTEETAFDILLVGGKDEAEKARALCSLSHQRVLNLIGKTTLVELACLLKRCRLLISGDSGPVHLAAAVGTPVIALFRNDLVGKTAKRWGPWGKGHRVIEKENLDHITVEEVLAQAREAINR